MKCEFCGAQIVGDPTFCAACCRATKLLSTKLSAFSCLKTVYASGQWKKQWKLALLMVVPLLAFIASFLFLTDFAYYLSLLIFLPVFLAPLAKGLAWHQRLVRFFPFAVCFVVYLFVLRTICQGDHILDLVYLIMCNYGMSLSLPIVFQISKGEKLLRAIGWSFEKIKETRWQQFFLLWALFLVNLVAILPLGLGLIFSLPFAYENLRHYSGQLDRYYQ